MTPKAAETMRVLETLTAKGWIVQVRENAGKLHAHAYRGTGRVASFEAQGSTVGEALSNLATVIQVLRPEQS